MNTTIEDLDDISLSDRPDKFIFGLIEIAQDINKKIGMNRKVSFTDKDSGGLVTIKFEFAVKVQPDEGIHFTIIKN